LKSESRCKSVKVSPYHVFDAFICDLSGGSNRAKAFSNIGRSGWYASHLGKGAVSLGQNPIGRQCCNHLSSAGTAGYWCRTLIRIIPNLHAVVKSVSEQGTRLNIRKETLRQWWRDFAKALHAQGVAANATERAVRGVTRTSRKDGIYRAMRRGESTRFEERVQSVAGDLQTGRVNPGHGKEQLLRTLRDVERGWASVSQLLKLDGDVDLADRVQQFARDMPPFFRSRMDGGRHHASLENFGETEKSVVSV
jgi:hypothetical protein